MGPEFLRRVFRNSLILGSVLGLVAGSIFGWRVGVDFLVGSLWGALSFRFLQLVILEATRPEGARWSVLAAVAVIKFPLLYGLGITWVLWRKPNPAATLAGLGVVLLVIVLQMLGRALVDSGYFSRPVPRGGKG